MVLQPFLHDPRTYRNLCSVFCGTGHCQSYTVAVLPEKTEKAPAKTDQATQGMPVFKIQICSSGHKLREDASQFKKLTPVEYYQENNLYKYTYGTTPSYKEIVALKKSIQDKFPDCFIVAFKGTQKISVQEALKQTNKK